ncbi:MAG: DUF5667 domain-containing protein [Patescibacteria group bacterium]
MKIIKSAGLLALIVPFLAFGQGQSAVASAGLTPENSLYFFDRFGEALQRFFTFNPEAKARLEISFAAERIAEIRVILDTKGVKAGGITVAEESLKSNLRRAAEILAGEKAKGKDIGQLANSLSDEVGRNKDLLKQTFEDQKDAIEKKQEELKAAIRVALAAGDTAKVDALTKELQDLKDQKKLLEDKEDEQEDAIDDEDEKLDEQMSDQKEVEEKIREAGKKKDEIVREAGKEGVEVPAGAFEEFDALLAKAQAAFDGGNYAEAKSFAKQAKKVLEGVHENVGELKDAQEKEDELEKDSEERQNEAEKKNQESLRESDKKAEEEQKQLLEKQKEQFEKDSESGAGGWGR